MAYTRDAHAGAGQAMTDLPPMQVFFQTAAGHDLQQPNGQPVHLYSACITSRAKST